MISMQLDMEFSGCCDLLGTKNTFPPWMTKTPLFSLVVRTPVLAFYFPLVYKGNKHLLNADCSRQCTGCWGYKDE